MGPIELADFVGLDTSEFDLFPTRAKITVSFCPAKHILDAWRKKVANGEKSVPAALVEESELLNKKVAEGKLGHKSGEGFLRHK